MISASINMQCWKCGVALKNVLIPFSRHEECSSCNTDLHVCVGCEHYDSNIADACREDRADSILEKDKANFCDYFKVNPSAYKKSDSAAAIAAKQELANLFGEDSSPAPQDEPSLSEAALSETPLSEAPLSEADKALVELNKLFGDDK